MDFLDPKSSATAEWYKLVSEAQARAGYRFDENLENYLVITLEHFMTDKQLVNAVIALNFLSGVSKFGRESGEKLRDVGDQCLLLSGLFPERALKKNVSLHYLIGIGQSAYGQLSLTQPNLCFDNELFSKLSINFIGLMDVLHNMRAMPEILRLQ